MWMYCEKPKQHVDDIDVVVIPLPNGELIDVDQKTGGFHEDMKTFDNFVMAACFTALKYSVMIGLCIEMICIVY